MLSFIAEKIRQTFCRHDWTQTEIYGANREGKAPFRLYKTRTTFFCSRCNKCKDVLENLEESRLKRITIVTAPSVTHTDVVVRVTPSLPEKSVSDLYKENIYD